MTIGSNKISAQVARWTWLNLVVLKHQFVSFVFRFKLLQLFRLLLNCCELLCYTYVGA